MRYEFQAVSGETAVIEATNGLIGIEPQALPRSELAAEILKIAEENRRLRSLLPVFKARRPEDEPHAAALTKLYEHWVLHGDGNFPDWPLVALPIP